MATFCDGCWNEGRRQIVHEGEGLYLQSREAIALIAGCAGYNSAVLCRKCSEQHPEAVRLEQQRQGEEAELARRQQEAAAARRRAWETTGRAMIEGLGFSERQREVIREAVFWHALEIDPRTIRGQVKEIWAEVMQDAKYQYPLKDYDNDTDHWWNEVGCSEAASLLAEALRDE